MDLGGIGRGEYNQNILYAILKEQQKKEVQLKET